MCTVLGDITLNKITISGVFFNSFYNLKRKYYRLQKNCINAINVVTDGRRITKNCYYCRIKVGKVIGPMFRVPVVCSFWISGLLFRPEAKVISALYSLAKSGLRIMT